MRPGPRVWLVTGASSGFGRALAELLLATGSAVIAASRQEAAVADLVARYPDRARAFELDLADLDSIPVRAAVAADYFGRIDVLVNNAGYAHIGPVEGVSDADLRAQFVTNVFAPWALIRAVLPDMRARGAGVIVNVSSQNGIQGKPGSGAYGASKAALEGMTESLAAETLEFGIRVLLVEPGSFRTGFRSRSIVFGAGRVDGYPDYAGQLLAKDRSHDGDPAQVAAAITRAVAADVTDLRLILGADAVALASTKVDNLVRDIEASVALLANIGEGLVGVETAASREG